MVKEEEKKKKKTNLDGTSIWKTFALLIFWLNCTFFHAFSLLFYAKYSEVSLLFFIPNIFSTKMPPEAKGGREREEGREGGRKVKSENKKKEEKTGAEEKEKVLTVNYLCWNLR